jgi:hypothetical protein
MVQLAQLFTCALVVWGRVGCHMGASCVVCHMIVCDLTHCVLNGLARGAWWKEGQNIRYSPDRQAQPHMLHSLQLGSLACASWGVPLFLFHSAGAGCG